MVTTISSSRPEYLEGTIRDFKRQVAHQFLYVGNTSDYVTPGVILRDYLARVFVGALPLAVFYSPDEGITFADEHALESGVEPFARNNGKTMREAFEAIGTRAGWLKPMGQAGAAASALGGGAPPAKRELPSGPRDAIGMLLRLMSTAGASAQVVIDGLDFIAPPQDKGTMPEARAALVSMLRRSGRDRAMNQSGNLLIMLSPSTEEVHEAVRGSSSGTFVYDVPLPDTERRLEFIQNKIEADSWLLDMSPPALAAQTAGLMLIQIEDIGLRIGATKNPVTADAVDSLKSELIKAECAGLLEIIKPRAGFDNVGGQSHFKDWAALNFVDPIESGDAARIREIPFSLMLSGPPGTGKTTLAEALGFEINWNLIVYKQVKDSLVGSSERNDAKAKRIIRAMAPAVVFMDEIDQLGGKRVTGGAGGGGDAVEASLFRSNLKFMEDTAMRGKLIIVGATNRPDQVDDAMSSRFEYRVPILPPEDNEARADVLVRLCNRYQIGSVDAGEDSQGAAMARALDTSDMLDAAKLMDGWAGRDMEGAIGKARSLVRRGMGAREAVEQAARTRRPLMRSDARYMTQLAISDCNDLDLLPAQYRMAADSIDREKLEQDIAAVRERSAAGERKFDI